MDLLYKCYANAQKRKQKQDWKPIDPVRNIEFVALTFCQEKKLFKYGVKSVYSCIIKHTHSNTTRQTENIYIYNSPSLCHIV